MRKLKNLDGAKPFDPTKLSLLLTALSISIFSNALLLPKLLVLSKAKKKLISYIIHCDFNIFDLIKFHKKLRFTILNKYEKKRNSIKKCFYSIECTFNLFIVLFFNS